MIGSAGRCHESGAGHTAITAKAWRQTVVIERRLALFARPSSVRERTISEIAITMKLRRLRHAHLTRSRHARSR